MLGGLIIGLFVAFLVYLENNTSASHKSSISQAVTSLFDKAKQDAREVRKQKQEAPPSPSDAKDSKPRFDFYTILPELEVAIPEQELIESISKPEQKKPSTKTGIRYILQAGSFRNPAQADQLKARLALQGIEANIQTVTINDGDTWHRVRVGPMQDLTALNRTRKRLHDNGIATMVVKEKG